MYRTLLVVTSHFERGYHEGFRGPPVGSLSRGPGQFEALWIDMLTIYMPFDIFEAFFNSITLSLQDINYPVCTIILQKISRARISYVFQFRLETELFWKTYLFIRHVKFAEYVFKLYA